MRALIACTVAAILLVNVVSSQIARAENPNADQIVKSLTPSPTMGNTRGVRLAPAEAPSVSLTVQFETGSAALTPQAVAVLNELGQALNNPSLAAYRFRIEGHTDTVGTPAYNQALSDRRAIAVAEYLASNFHIDRSRMQPVGMGVAGLLVATADQTPEPRNRRVQVVNIGS